jgi:hypothetical protein
MEIIEFKINEKNFIQAGIPKSGTIQFILSCAYPDSGEILNSEIQISGYSGEAKYKFHHSKNDGLIPIQIGLSLEKSLQLPEVTVPIKAKMPDDVKLDLYNRLKNELEEAGII